MLIEELEKIKGHLTRVHVQHKVFKKAQEEALTELDVSTLQID